MPAFAPLGPAHPPPHHQGQLYSVFQARRGVHSPDCCSCRRAGPALTPVGPAQRLSRHLGRLFCATQDGAGATLPSAVACKGWGQLCTAFGHQHGPRERAIQARDVCLAFGANMSLEHRHRPLLPMAMDTDMALGGGTGWDRHSHRRQGCLLPVHTQ